jgi:hypothetical protein
MCFVKFCLGIAIFMDCLTIHLPLQVSCVLVMIRMSCTQVRYYVFCSNDHSPRNGRGTNSLEVVYVMKPVSESITVLLEHDTF